MIGTQNSQFARDVDVPTNDYIDGKLVVAQSTISHSFELHSLTNSASLLLSTLLITTFAYYNVALRGTSDSQQMLFNAAVLVAVAIVPYSYCLEKIRKLFFPIEAKNEIQECRQKGTGGLSLSSNYPLSKAEFLKVVCLPSILLCVTPLLGSLILSNYLPSMLASTLSVFFGCSIFAGLKDYVLINQGISEIPDNANVFYNDKLSYWKCNEKKKFSDHDKMFQTVITVLIFMGLMLLYFQSFWCLIPFYLGALVSTLCKGRIYSLFRWANFAGILDAVLVMTNFFA